MDFGSFDPHTSPLLVATLMRSLSAVFAAYPCDFGFYAIIASHPLFGHAHGTGRTHIGDGRAADLLNARRDHHHHGSPSSVPLPLRNLCLCADLNASVFRTLSRRIAGSTIRLLLSEPSHGRIRAVLGVPSGSSNPTSASTSASAVSSPTPGAPLVLSVRPLLAVLPRPVDHAEEGGSEGLRPSAFMSPPTPLNHDAFTAPPTPLNHDAFTAPPTPLNHDAFTAGSIWLSPSAAAHSRPGATIATPSASSCGGSFCTGTPRVDRQDVMSPDCCVAVTGSCGQSAAFPISAKHHATAAPDTVASPPPTALSSSIFHPRPSRTVTHYHCLALRTGWGQRVRTTTSDSSDVPLLGRFDASPPRSGALKETPPPRGCLASIALHVAPSGAVELRFCDAAGGVIAWAAAEFPSEHPFPRDADAHGSPSHGLSKMQHLEPHDKSPAGVSPQPRHSEDQSLSDSEEDHCRRLSVPITRRRTFSPSQTRNRSPPRHFQAGKESGDWSHPGSHLSVPLVCDVVNSDGATRRWRKRPPTQDGPSVPEGTKTKPSAPRSLSVFALSSVETAFRTALESDFLYSSAGIADWHRNHVFGPESAVMSPLSMRSLTPPPRPLVPVSFSDFDLLLATERRNRMAITTKERRYRWRIVLFSEMRVVESARDAGEVGVFLSYMERFSRVTFEDWESDEWNAIVTAVSCFVEAFGKDWGTVGEWIQSTEQSKLLPGVL